MAITENDMLCCLPAEYRAAQEQQTAGEDELLSASERLIRQKMKDLFRWIPEYRI